MNKKLHILLVDLQYDYGNQQRGPNLIGKYGFHGAIEALGHRVTPFYYDHDLTGSKKLQEELLTAADNAQPDLIIFPLFQDQFHISTLQKLKEKFRTLVWFGDDTWRFQSFSIRYAPHFHFVVTTDKYSIPLYKKIGIENVILSQWAASDTHPDTLNRINVLAQHNKPDEYIYDVSFVGQYHPYRDWFTQQLRKRGFSVHCFGFGWPNGSLSSQRMAEVFFQSKINLNLSNSVHFHIDYLAKYPKAIFHALRKVKKTRSQIKARHFEIPFFGGFQLTEYTPGLEDWLDIGKEVACYTDIDDAEAMIRYYLENEIERELMRNKSEIRARAAHGFRSRWKNILSEVEKSTA